MKFFLSLLALALIGLSQHQVQAACTVEDGVNTGVNNITIAFRPTSLELIEMAGLGNNKSPKAFLNLLDSPLNPVVAASKVVATGMAAMARLQIFNKIPIPDCVFTWVTNELHCHNVHPIVAKGICALSDLVAKVTKAIKLPMPLPQPAEIHLQCENDPRWGLKTVNAQAAWDLGAKGEGVVVANLDSGVRATHEELRDNQRATYNWFDGTNPSNLVPRDDTGHGTHTMASVCGKTVGVAPDAEWIACKGCDPNGCGNEQLTLCGQWLLCPDNGTLDCSTKPNVINNSWGGGIGNTWYQPILTMMKNAGIINLFSSGNSGPICASVKSPADSDQEKFGIISVGSSACNEAISFFSSTGPSQAADYMGKLGISIVAPGSNIFSAWNTNDSATNIISGTSQSCPHATGAVAVLLSKQSGLSVDQVRTILQDSAYRNPNVTSAIGVCGTSNSSNLLGPWPNNVYGYGRVDLLRAVNTVL